MLPFDSAQGLELAVSPEPAEWIERRRRRLRRYLEALQSLTQRKRPRQRDAMQQAIGAAKKDAGRDARFVILEVSHHGQGRSQRASLRYHIDPAKRWEFYLQPTEVEQACKELKGDPFDYAQGTRFSSAPSISSATTASKRTSL